MSERLGRELRLHVKAIKRIRQRKLRSHIPASVETIDTNSTLLLMSSGFFDGAKEWHVVLWWRPPQVELKSSLRYSTRQCLEFSHSSRLCPCTCFSPHLSLSTRLTSHLFDFSACLSRGSWHSGPSRVSVEPSGRPSIVVKTFSTREILSCRTLT